MIGILFMIFADQFLMPEGTAFHELWTKQVHDPLKVKSKKKEPVVWYEEGIIAQEPIPDYHKNLKKEPYGPVYEPVVKSEPDEEKITKTEPDTKKDVLPVKPLWQENSLSTPFDPDKPKIVIVIDDLGPAVKRTQEITDLPGPLTLAFLPYASQLDKKISSAKDQGHEILIHMPMQPMSDKVNPGPMTLKEDLSAEDLNRFIDDAFLAVKGAVGLNNHMGSRFTKNKEAVDKLMDKLSKKGALFLDSRTTPETVCVEAATKYNVPVVSRDVFLDHKHDKAFIKDAISNVERISKKYGQVIAIGHPNELTIKALDEWIPRAKAQGFQFVPLSALVKEKYQITKQDQ